MKLILASITIPVLVTGNKMIPPWKPFPKDGKINFAGHESLESVQKYYKLETKRQARKMVMEQAMCGFQDNLQAPNGRILKTNNRAWKDVNAADGNNQRKAKTRVTFEVTVDPNLLGDNGNGGTQEFTPRKQCRAIITALEEWQKIADVEFIELERTDGVLTCSQLISPECYQRMTKKRIPENEAPMMRIGFGRHYHYVGENCNYPFDGNWGTLAHAWGPGSYWPIDGDTHFDTDEKWTYRANSDQYSGPDLMIVAFHEFGHALGLPHNSYERSIMYPTYAWKDWKKGWEVEPYDVQLIQDLYGPQTKKIRSCFAKAKRRASRNLEKAVNLKMGIDPRLRIDRFEQERLLKKSHKTGKGVNLPLLSDEEKKEIGFE